MDVLNSSPYHIDALSFTVHLDTLTIQYLTTLSSKKFRNFPCKSDQQVPRFYTYLDDIDIYLLIKINISSIIKNVCIMYITGAGSREKTPKWTLHYGHNAVPIFNITYFIKYTNKVHDRISKVIFEY